MTDRELSAETAQPMFVSHVGRRKWEQLQADGYRMQRIQFARSVDGKETRGSISAWGNVEWETEPTTPAGCALLQVITTHPQDYVLLNTADGTRWRGAADGRWVREQEASHG